MIEIDGSGGGGQMLRTALGISALTKQAFRITNIRKNRQNPGLRPQHLACVKAVAQLCNAIVDGAELSSPQLTFYPRDIKDRTLSIVIGTAGSITLLLQSLLPTILFGGKTFRIRVKGGTDVPFSPPADYFANVLLPHLKKFCEKLDFTIHARGFFPEGGGEAELFVRPKHASFTNLMETLRSDPIAPIVLDQRNAVLQLRGTSIASSQLQKAQVAERQAQAARLALSKIGIPVTMDSHYMQSRSIGTAITLWAVCGNEESSHINPVIIGASALGEQKKRAEDVGAEAAHSLLTQLNTQAPVDIHLADQLIPFLALASGTILVSEISPHTLANIHVTELFLGKRFVIVQNLIKAV